MLAAGVLGIVAFADEEGPVPLVAQQVFGIMAGHLHVPKVHAARVVPSRLRALGRLVLQNVVQVFHGHAILLQVLADLLSLFVQPFDFWSETVHVADQCPVHNSFFVDVDFQCLFALLYTQPATLQ